MRVTSKGQITIPKDIREKFGFLPDTEVEFVVKGHSVMLRKAEKGNRRGKNLVRHLRGKATVKLTTEQIMALTRRE